MTGQGGNVLAWLDDAIRHRETWAEQAAAVQGPFWSAQSLGTGGRTVFYVGGSDIDDISRMNSRLVTAENQAVTPHIALNDPASVLRRCAADRKLLELHTPTEWPTGTRAVCPSCARWDNDTAMGDDAASPVPFPCPTVFVLAEGYGWVGGSR